ncbi:Sulfotransferase domain protein [Thalassoglobus neptunius]|uniref:Sulfotransferase domain protein n=1 Tax=Thalassoglobus neptunius TaxID=1938619 RepID=A0A5C5X7J3_9PLAN|nr:sulfotransferase [Thalassoglobus neptunius]TWT58233.1 Sulfotransferase domain protein [Thalassoglobus neptunius]
MSEEKKTKPKRSSQGPFSIWHGMKISGLYNLMKLGPQLSWTKAGRIALLPPMALYNSTMAAVESLLYGRRIRETEPVAPPIFILGFWRSGTTLLHNLMDSDPQFTTTTLYQTVFPWHFLTTQTVASRLTAAFIPESRPMDNVRVGWDVAQEDEVALCVMTQLSPYLMVTFPYQFEIIRRYIDIEAISEQDRQRWCSALDTLIRKVTLRTPKQLVLKSPSHTFRIQTLLKMYPGAKFIYIYRDPFDVFNSNCHLRQTMATENTLGENPKGGFEDDVIKWYNEGFTSYQTNKWSIPEGDLCEVKYEELAADPLGQMNRIYEQLSLQNVDAMRAAIEPQVEELKKYKKNKFDRDPHWVKEVYQRCRAAYDEFGYPPPNDGQIEAA